AGMQAGMSRGARVFNPLFLTGLAQAHIQLGQWHEASASMARAITAIEATGERWAEAEVHRAAGELAIAQPDGNTEQAEACLQRSLTIARQQKGKSWELRTATSLARLWREHGRNEEARDLLVPVYDWFTEGFDTPDLQQANALLTKLHASRADR